MALLQVVGISIPDPSLIRIFPNSIIKLGTHYSVLEGLGKKWNTQQFCNGDIILSEGYKDIIGDSAQDKDWSKIQFTAKCLRCNTTLFSFNRKGWRAAMLDWMCLAVGTIIMKNAYNNTPSIAMIFETIKQEIKVCKPDMSTSLLCGAPEVIETPPQEDLKDSIFCGRIRWDNYGLVITRLLDIEDVGYDFLILDIAILLTEMEKSFQNAINKSAQLACSASEPFHPNTRRNNGGK
jgi:hypothetical protein